MKNTLSTILRRVFLTLLGLSALYLSLLGAYLLYLGGSPYYVLSGIALAAVCYFASKRSFWSLRIYGLLLLLTIPWAWLEAEGQFLSLLPRVAMWMGLALFIAILPIVDADARREKWRWLGLPSALCAVALLLVQEPVAVAPGTERAEVKTLDADWRHYGSSVGGTRFSSAEQISADNVAGLKEVWRYRTGVKKDFKATPLQVDGVLYFCAAGNIVIALRDDTGEELWRFDPEATISAEHQYAITCRGVSYHENLARKGKACAKRILTATVDARLMAVDAETGALCEDFGTAGAVDLREGMGPHLPSQYYHTSPPLIADDLAVVGGLVMDSQRMGLPSGVVRAFDVETGEFAWAWDVGRPDDNGMPEEGERFTPGTPNVWSLMSYDSELQLIYAPTGNASPDYFGSTRRDVDDEWSSAVVALHVDSGKPAWKFQTVYHDVWDYDVPSQPTLVEVGKDGEKIPALAMPTKRGEIFLLDRRDGSPVHPIEDRAVPQGDEVSNRLAPTQPFSSLPNFRPHLYERDMWGLTPLDQLLCRVEYKMMRYEGHFTPPTPGGSIQFPGNFGGFNWGGVSVDADNGLLVAAPMRLANRILLVTPERVAEAGARASALLGNYHPAVDMGEGVGAHVPDAHDNEGEYDHKKIKYYGLTMPFISRFALPFIGGTEVPCFEPPWSEIAVIDLNTNKELWRRPLGAMNDSGPFGLRSGLPFDVGVPVRAATLSTRGGLTFMSSTMDSTVRAFDLRSGETLWKQALPGSSQATPMSYVSPRDGRQYVIVTVPNPSWRYPRDPKTGTYTDSQSVDDGLGGYVIAYALDN